MALPFAGGRREIPWVLYLWSFLDISFRAGMLTDRSVGKEQSGKVGMKMSRREEIIKVATRLFARKGFCQTAVSEVAKEAGVAQGTVFHHFKSKQNLLAAICDDLIQEYIRGIRDAASGGGAGWEAVERVLRFSQEFRKRRSESLVVAFRETGADERRDPGINEYFQRLMEQVLEVKEKCILLGLADGSIRQVPPRETALIIHALLAGILVLDSQGLLSLPDLDKDVQAFCRRSLAAGGGPPEGGRTGGAKGSF